MLQQTFCHITGIGANTETKLWQAGIRNWGDISIPCPVRLSGASIASLPSSLEESLVALEHNPAYFTDKLPSAERWRVFSEFRDSTAYVDIETTGLSDTAEITTIALYDGKNIYHYINGHNLDDFPQDLQKYKVLVTYNGTGFDLPVIKRYFGIQLPHAHIDLRYVLASLGIKGGLKKCEKQLGLDRGDLDGVDGYFAVRLWREYKKNNDLGALQTLVAYNIEDTVNMETLMVEAYNRKITTTPFSDKVLPRPDIPESPFKADLSCINRLLGRN